MNLDKHPCSFCGKQCYRHCYIGHRLSCVSCFDRLAVQPALDRLVADRDSATECWREVVDRVAATEIERDRLLLGMEIAWGLIANANQGDWDGETEEWREAAGATNTGTRPWIAAHWRENERRV